MLFNRSKHFYSVAAVFALLTISTLASTALHAATVTLAGFAYSGDSKTISTRFPYTKRLEITQATAGSPLNKQIAQMMAKNKPANFEINQSTLAELKGQDQAVVVALIITGETVSTERFGNIAKLLTQVRAQAMFFDFKSMTVLRAYPFSFSHLDVIDHFPTQAELNDRFQSVYYGAQGKAGIFARFAEAVNLATLPTSVPRFVQVSQVNIGDEAREVLSKQVKGAANEAETFVADVFAESLSSKTGIPMLPFAKGYAIGNAMSMRIADGDVYMLKLPEPDYTITLSVPRFRKIKSAEVAAGASYIYGAYSHVIIQEPTSGRLYLDADFKNGEVKLVPASQDTTDDFPAYYDAMKGLYVKLATNLAGTKTDWLSSATAAPDISQQITSTKELLKSCK
jgi:hypothetical protein